eukprot:TRINITY_DN4152_c0_g1_i1.p1 TRINITY_DN4152_c0_g1~~TRINITY_DN4152_c0_g1_i1.p1  ORF type:complete len:442 (+),score=43.85 TRINITY_DN4152_c0_g1_i1:29-1327(+)
MIFEVSLLFLISNYFFDTYLSYRQYLKRCEKSKPKELTFVHDVKFQEAQVYGQKKSVFSFASSGYAVLLELIVLFANMLPLLWSKAASLPLWIGWKPEESETTQSLAFVTIYLLLFTILNHPFELYDTFVVEKQFNTQTLGEFYKDMARSAFFFVVLGLPILAALIKIIRWGGPHAYLYAFVFFVLIQLVMVWIYPILIEPCFNTVKPLPDSELKTQVQELAHRLKFPLYGIFEIDGSKRSTHSNAYLFGLCNKRIVLYDTLIKESTIPEIVAVLAHELGHWKHSHTYKMMGLTLVHSFALLYVFNQFMYNDVLYTAFGFEEHPVVIGLILFQFLWTPIERVLGFALTVLSRKFEFQADRFACSLHFGEALEQGLIKLHEKNLGDMNPDWLYSTINYSHPPLVERLQAIHAHIDSNSSNSSSTSGSEHEKSS